MRFTAYYLAGMLKIYDVFEEPRLHLRLENLDFLSDHMPKCPFLFQPYRFFRPFNSTRGKTVA